MRLFTPQAAESTGRAGAARGPADAVFRRLGLRPDAGLVQQVRRGFRVAAVAKLAGELGVPQQTVLKVARIASATLARRRKSASGRLSAEESDRVYRIAAAYRDAVQLFEGDAEAARRWLNEPAKALGGERPLQYLATEAGAAEVRALIARLEHGVYT